MLSFLATKKSFDSVANQIFQIRPVRELLSSAQGVIQGDKPVRNALKFTAIAGGMVVGGYYCVTDPTLNGWAQGWISSFFAQPTSAVITNGLVGTFGVLLGGTAADIVSKNLYNQVWSACIVGGDPNARYNISGKNAELLMEEGNFVDPSTLDHGHWMQGCLPLNLCPSLQQKYVGPNRWQWQKEINDFAQSVRSEGKKYKHDGTGREQPFKHAIRQMTQGYFMPTYQLAVEKELAAQARQTDTDQMIIKIDALIERHPNARMTDVLNVSENTKRQLGQLMKYYADSCNTIPQYNTLTQAANPLRVNTIQDLNNLRALAVTYQAKMQNKVAKFSHWKTRLKPACVLEI